MTLELWIVGSGVVFLIFLWTLLGMRHLKHLQDSVMEQWELVGDDLRKRHDMVPNLIETIRQYDQGQGEFVKKFITDRENARREYDVGSKKIELEHALSLRINEAFNLGAKNKDLGSDTNFLELKREIDDLEQNIEERVNKYNEMVRFFNKHRGIVILKPVAAIGKYGRLNIFEVEI